MTTLEQFRVHVSPGLGLVGRFPMAVLVVPGYEEGQASAVETLLHLCGSPAGPGGGRALARRVAGFIAAATPDDLPSFAVLTDVDDRSTGVLVCGDVVVTIGLEGQVVDEVSGADSLTWVDRVVQDATSFTVRDRRPDGQSVDPRSDLRAGVVPGDGAQLLPRSPQSQQTARQARVGEAGVDGGVATAAFPPPDRSGRLSAVGAVPSELTAPASSTSQSFQPVSLTEPEKAAPRAALPDVDVASPPAEAESVVQDDAVRVEGILCPVGHLNDPRSNFCHSCGRSLVHVTHKGVQGPRPALGVLIGDDSSIHTLDSDYVLGRDPSSDDRVQHKHARPLRFGEEDDTVSRVHAEVRLRDWDVFLVDRGSANGTYLAAPDENQWQPLQPGKEVRVPPGSKVRVGDRTMIFESPHRI